MYAAISSCVRTGVGIQRHNSSSSPTSTSPARCVFASGSIRTCAPSRNIGETTISVGSMVGQSYGPPFGSASGNLDVDGERSKYGEQAVENWVATPVRTAALFFL